MLEAHPAPQGAEPDAPGAGPEEDVDDLREPEATGSTTTSINLVAQRAGASTEAEVKSRRKLENKYSFEKHTQSSHLMRDLLASGADVADRSAYAAMAMARAVDFHNTSSSSDLEWPDYVEIEDLKLVPEEEFMKYQRYVVCLSFSSEQSRARVNAILSNLRLEVAKLQLGHQSDPDRTCFATVAFRHVRDRERLLDSVELRNHVWEVLGVTNMYNFLQPASDLVKASRVYFKNHHRLDLDVQQLEALAREFSPDATVRVTVSYYWDYILRDKAQEPTEVVFTGYLQFSAPEHARALKQQLEDERLNGSNWRVLRGRGSSTGIHFPIHFYENPS